MTTFEFRYHADIDAPTQEEAHRQFLQLLIQAYPSHATYDHKAMRNRLYVDDRLTDLDPHSPPELQRYEVRYGGTARQEVALRDSYTAAKRYVAELEAAYGSTMTHCDIIMLNED